MADNNFYSSKQYGWNDISAAAGGRIYEGITNIEFTRKQEKDVLRGRGGKGHQILRGNESVEGKIELWQSEVEAMIKDAPDNDILKLNFDLVWTFAASALEPTVTDIIVSCEITEYKKAMKQGDKNMLIELPFIALSVKHQQ